MGRNPPASLLARLVLVLPAILSATAAANLLPAASPGASSKGFALRRTSWGGHGNLLGPFGLASRSNKKRPSSLIYLSLRGGESEEAEVGEKEEQESTETPAATTAATDAGTTENSNEDNAAKDADKKEEEELSVEATEDESEMALGGQEVLPEEDIVEISADAFVHPAHPEYPEEVVGGGVEEKEEVEVGIADGGAADADADEVVVNFSPLEDEDEGSTTPVTPDDEDYSNPADAEEVQDLEAEDMGGAAKQGDCGSAAISEEMAPAAEEAIVDEATVAPAATEGVPTHYAAEEETDYPRGQGAALTDGDSAAFVDPMDLADDEGETASAAEGVGEGLQQQVPDNLAAAAAAGPPPVDESPPTVQYVVTRNMRRVLTDELGYTSEEVEKMKPDVAAVLTSKRLKRPSGGMPDEFYIDGKAPTTGGSRFNRIVRSRVVRRVVVPALIAGASWGATKPIRSSGGGGGLSRKGAVSEPRLRAEPANSTKAHANSGAGMAASAEKRKMANLPPTMKAPTEPPAPTSRKASKTGDDGPSDRDSEEMLQLMEDEGLSVGSKYPRDLDESWLDKCITFVLEKLDNIFRFRF